MTPPDLRQRGVLGRECQADLVGGLFEQGLKGHPHCGFAGDVELGNLVKRNAIGFDGLVGWA